MPRPNHRAFCNAALLALLVLAPGRGLAVAPPRPGTTAQTPPVLQHWPGPKPGLASHAAPAMGTDKSTLLHRLPVLPGGFSDRAGSVPVADLQTVFTGANSVQDYYDEASGGRLDVQGQVGDWLRAPQNRSYYAGDDNGMDLWGAPNNAGRFVRDLVTLADQAGFDWGPYDNDGPDGVPNSGDDDGRVDCVVIVHAGPGGECGTADLWSHCFFLAGWGYGTYTTATPRAGGGHLLVDDYVLVPELSCGGGVIEIGVICHEYGHVLGLPDLYDTASSRAGIGGWGLMGSGSWGGDGASPDSPSHPSAWSRCELGWVTPQVVRQDDAVSLAAGAVLSVRDPDMTAGEYFLIENRRRTGYDASLPGEGLLIWHIDEEIIDRTRPLNEVNVGTSYGVALEEADGLDQLLQVTGGNRGDAGDPWPGSAGATRFAAGTQPSSLDNAGRRTDVLVRGIPTPRPLADFFVEVGVPYLDTDLPQVAILVPAGDEEWTLGDMQSVVWTASDPGGITAVDLRLSYDGGMTFPRRLATGLADTGVWTGTLGPTPGELLVISVTARDPEGNAGTALSGVFALVDRYGPGVVLTLGPGSGDQLAPQDAVALAWVSADNVGVVTMTLEWSRDGGATWQPADGSGLPANGSTVWTVPDLFCPTARLRLAARDAAGNLGTAQSEVFGIIGATITTDVPDVQRLSLGPCVPNPFNPRAEIAFSLPRAGRVQLLIHDAAGRLVRRLLDEPRGAGVQRVVWNGRDDQGRHAASGVYYIRAQGPGGRALLKVTLVR